MANNPTLDVLTEMHEYGMGLKLAVSEMNNSIFVMACSIFCNDIHCIVFTVANFAVCGLFEHVWILILKGIVLW